MPTFSVGDKVVYPMHGAGIIESIEEKEVLEEKRQYYILKMPIGNMKVMIPVDNGNNIGLRSVIDAGEVIRVLSVLKERDTTMYNDWNRRYRAHMEMIKSGNIFEVAEVVKNLILRDKEKGLSTGERKMLDNAKKILVSELVLADDSEEEKIEEILDNAFA